MHFGRCLWQWRSKLVELAVEQDDDLMMSYLEGEEPTVEQLKACIRKGTLENAFVPVLTGTAFKNKGVQPLLDAVIDYMQVLLVILWFVLAVLLPPSDGSDTLPK